PPVISTLSLHDALPISGVRRNRLVLGRWLFQGFCHGRFALEFQVMNRSSNEEKPQLRDDRLFRVFRRFSVSSVELRLCFFADILDRKSTRLNSSHVSIS